LSRWARQQQLTVNTVVQGAWALLLSRYSGSEDVVFGTTVAGRSAAALRGIESMVGLFINTLPVRVHVSDSHSVVPWLTALQEQQVTLREYEYTPLYEIQKWNEVPAGAPFFNTLLAFENIPLESGGNLMAGTAGLNFQRVAGSRGGETNYPLTVVVIPGRTLQVQFTYDTNHYTAEAITRMVGHFQQVLTGIIADRAQTRLGAIPLLSEAERQLMLVEWNATEASYLRDVCIHDLFEAQVQQTPDAVALVFGEDTLTYDELNTRANQLAHYLRKSGVGPEVLVGICLERSLEMIVGLLGILKAGGAYLPLDPAYPKERLAFILQDTAVPVLLTQQPLLAALPEYGAKVICLDANWEIIAKEKTDNLVSEATAENLAYVIYTSGSTGKPKGVLVSHGNVMRLMKATEPWYNFDQEDVWTLFHSYAFDFSVWEIWGALLYGARLVIVPYDVSRSPKDFYNLLVNERVTVLNQTPSAFYQLIQAEETLLPKNDLALRLIIFGGEALELQSLKLWFKRHGDQNPQLVNMYGITETTVHVTYRPITNEDVQSGQGSVIGERIPDLQLYVLDGNLQPVPIGVAGELFVGGAGLARGYLNRPELTVERFIPNPYSNKPGARLYKTGDVARYLPNGDLEYLGRADQQVQIRGFRVEPSEIEVVLTGYPGVNMAVVMAREDRPGDKRLVAYVVASHEPTPTFGELRSFLKEKLPDYMIPSAFMYLDCFPITPNGKVDRRALPAPDLERFRLETKFVAPRTPVEKVLAKIWREVLGLERVGARDNFYELGGHSLLATQVVARVGQTFEVELPLRVFFENPTVAGLTEVLENYDTMPGRVLAIAQISEKIDAMDAEEIRKMLHDKRKR
jgi:amino acid adenylation domain-containing protein